MTTDDAPQGAAVQAPSRDVARVLALLDASRHSLAALAAAVELASQRHVELVALYVEDLDLLRCAAFPFSCEIGAQSGLARPLTPEALEASIAHQLRRVRQALATAVAGRELRHRLEVSRGRIAAEALARSGPEDVLVLGKAGSTECWGKRLGTTSRRLIMEAPCSVLLWDEAHPFRRGPLRWLAAHEDDPARKGAVPSQPAWLASLFDGISPLALRHAAELERGLDRASAGGLLLRRCELEALLREDEQLVARVPLPILIIP
ncbi:universal stress protein [Halomonas sp. MCCC 1A17488]|uniref:universal stress protein n=1 Tax=unclassified Halomonas TaxID=2609666 RepID=UPI0018D216F5|nr:MULTISPECIES: universal stress protein [unclassified Halomonas]MCE8014940.1 universal stress protein [Halomonas sp. MCCC 1A17488]MCG3238273.1 universal stress protein [Halomonas sp. MCCC 1A17488]QPP47967.1 universal stress protein [Halomonas sp. SS10-MC5]